MIAVLEKSMCLPLPSVAGRRADQSRDGVSFGQLAHVQLDQPIAIAEKDLRQGPGKLGLSYAGGTKEEK